ncbi:MAG: hypothetical protein WCH34_12470 [Bacteroidota bacterium]
MDIQVQPEKKDSTEVKLRLNGGNVDDRTGKWKWDFEELASDEFYITDFGFEFLKACER